MKKPKSKKTENPPDDKSPDTYEHFEFVRIGRLPHFLKPEDLEKKIQEYFDKECGRFPILLRDDKTGEILKNPDTQEPEIMKSGKGNPIYDTKFPTVSGLALFLGFSNRRSLYDYRDKKPSANTTKDAAYIFSHTIKKAITFIENIAENNLMKNEKPVGAIFWLKNHGWKDETTEHHKIEQIKVKPPGAGRGAENFPSDDE